MLGVRRTRKEDVGSLGILVGVRRLALIAGLTASPRGLRSERRAAIERFDVGCGNRAAPIGIWLLRASGLIWTPRRLVRAGVAISIKSPGAAGPAPRHRGDSSGGSARAPRSQLGWRGVFGRHGWFGRRRGGAEGELGQAGQLPYLPPLVRHAPAGGRLRHPHGAGVAGPCGREHDHDLHSRSEPRRQGSAESAGRSGMTSDRTALPDWEVLEPISKRNRPPIPFVAAVLGSRAWAAEGFHAWEYTHGKANRSGKVARVGRAASAL